MSSSSNLAQQISLFRYLNESWNINSYGVKGSFYTENPHANFTSTTLLSGHYDCRENPVVNCGSLTASFAYLVIALGVLIFGIYVVRQRRETRQLVEMATAEGILVDKEGWERKSPNDEQQEDGLDPTPRTVDSLSQADDVYGSTERGSILSTAVEERRVEQREFEWCPNCAM
ncbi:hypothetical protein J2P12_08030, partial [Candidatus Bathyarchaeota archaeon]|nr:hypothetical protein [Candidatus Bathyarchaeota archaeon]